MKLTVESGWKAGSLKQKYVGATAKELWVPRGRPLVQGT